MDQKETKPENPRKSIFPNIRENPITKAGRKAIDAVLKKKPKQKEKK